MAFTSKIHVQSWTLMTCNCWVLCVFDAFNHPPVGPIDICCALRVCPGHTVGTPAGAGKLRWVDGNWKDLKLYIQYQQDWYKWVNNVEWKERQPLDMFGDPQPMPETIAPFDTEPVTPGSVPAPAAQEITDLDQIWTWILDHDGRYNDTMVILENELGDREGITWRFEGHGDSRILYVSEPRVVGGAAARVQATADIQFGPGKIVVE